MRGLPQPQQPKPLSTYDARTPAKVERDGDSPLDPRLVPVQSSMQGVRNRLSDLFEDALALRVDEAAGLTNAAEVDDLIADIRSSMWQHEVAIVESLSEATETPLLHSREAAALSGASPASDGLLTATPTTEGNTTAHAIAAAAGASLDPGPWSSGPRTPKLHREGCSKRVADSTPTGALWAQIDSMSVAVQRATEQVAHHGGTCMHTHIYTHACVHARMRTCMRMRVHARQVVHPVGAESRVQAAGWIPRCARGDVSGGGDMLGLLTLTLTLTPHPHPHPSP